MAFPSFEPNGEGKWSIYYQRFVFHCKRKKIATDDAMMKAELVSVSSDEMFEYMESVSGTSLSSEALTFAALCTSIEKQMTVSNVIAASAAFNTRNQLQNESITDYMTVLRKMAKECEYGDHQDRAIRDRLVAGVRDMDIRAMLFRGGAKMKADEAFQIAKSVEMSNKHAADAGNISLGLGAFHQKSYGKKKCSRCEGERHNANCWRCEGIGHKPDECHFAKTRCRFCNFEGHIEKACIKKKKQMAKKQQSMSVQALKATQPTPSQQAGPSFSGAPSSQQEYVPVNAVYEETTYNEYQLYHARQVLENAAPNSFLVPPPLMFQALVDGRRMEFEIDSGAPITIISEATLRRFWPTCPLMVQSPIRLATWTQTPVPIKGCFWVTVSAAEKTARLPVYIGGGSGVSLLGRQWFETCGIRLEVNQLSEETQPDPARQDIITRYECGQPTLGEYRGELVSLTVPALEVARKTTPRVRVTAARKTTPRVRVMAAARARTARATLTTKAPTVRRVEATAARTATSISPKPRMTAANAKERAEDALRAKPEDAVSLPRQQADGSQNGKQEIRTQITSVGIVIIVTSLIMNFVLLLYYLVFC